MTGAFQQAVRLSGGQALFVRAVMADDMSCLTLVRTAIFGRGREGSCLVLWVEIA